MKFKKEDFIDQPAHAAIVIVTLLLASTGGVLACALAGFIVGAAVEIKESSARTTLKRALNAIATSKKDIAFYVLAGVLYGAFYG